MTEVSVVAFDPGETTGWAVMSVPVDVLTEAKSPLNEAITEVGARRWAWGQLDSRALGSAGAGAGVGRGHDALNFLGENMAVDDMMNLAIRDYPEAPVILEKFVLNPKVASGKFDLLSPVRIISAFSYALHVEAMSAYPDKTYRSFRDPYKRFNLINRGDPKKTCSDDRLKAWGFGSVVSHKHRHAADATRIAYFFLRDCVGESYKAQDARWRAWPHIFEDPAVSEIKKQYPKSRRPPGERI